MTIFENLTAIIAEQQKGHETTAAKLHGMVDAIRANDPETADKLSAALKAFGKSL